jgi:hypothetical protein
MRANALTKTFNLVTSTREKGLVFSHFNPLPENKVVELKGFLDQSLRTKEVKEDASLKEALQKASGTLDRYSEMLDIYNKMPQRVPTPLYKGPLMRPDGTFGHMVIGMTTMESLERGPFGSKCDKVISGVQKDIYKDIKSHYKKTKQAQPK